MTAPTVSTASVRSILPSTDPEMPRACLKMGRARWRRCLSVTDRCGSASSARLANRTLLSQTEPLPIFRQALRNPCFQLGLKGLREG
jgi:hypothetical protein